LSLGCSAGCPGGLPTQPAGSSSGLTVIFTGVTMAAYEDATAKGYQSPIYTSWVQDTKVSVHV